MRKDGKRSNSFPKRIGWLGYCDRQYSSSAHCDFSCSDSICATSDKPHASAKKKQIRTLINYSNYKHCNRDYVHTAIRNKARAIRRACICAPMASRVNLYRCKIVGGAASPNCLNTPLLHPLACNRMCETINWKFAYNSCAIFDCMYWRGRGYTTKHSKIAYLSAER